MSETEKITLLIVDDIPETRDNLSKLLYFEPNIEIVGTAANGKEAIEQAQELQPNIVLMDINMPDMDGITASQEITQVAPMCQVIMMSVQSEADYLRRSMLAGAMDFLTKPFTSEELSSSIHRVYEMGASRRAAMPMMRTTADGMPLDPSAADHQPSTGGKLLLVYSPKGGTGCSTVATNLALALERVTSKKIALIDASLQFGDADVLLNLQGHGSIADAAARLNELDSDLLSAIMTPHPSGIKVLAAPATPEQSETITGDEIKAILEATCQDFDYIIMDTWSLLDEVVLSAMDLADRILLVLTPEIPAIRSTKQFFEVAEALQFPLDRIDLILNKVIPRDGIRPEQLEGSIKHEILVQLDLDPRSMRQATNQGMPLIQADANHPLAKSFLDLAQTEVTILEPQPEEKPEEEAIPQPQERRRRAGLFGRLRK